MSYLLPDTALETCTAAARHPPCRETWPPREADLGAGLKVTRALPVRGHRRLVGPWCFFDHYGPLDFSARKAMDIAPHPHIGLQTVSWLFAGESLHHDSLGSVATATPGTLNLMTAGHGIAHSEETPARHSGHLHGLQLWVALPDAARDGAPHFDHYTDLPTWEPGGGRAQVFMGRLGPADAATRTFSPLVGADLRIKGRDAIELPLEATWEHALYVIDGAARLDGMPLTATGLTYLGTGRASLRLQAAGDGARIILIGGAPFGAAIVMWWNFVGRNSEDIRAARDAWQRGEPRFGTVHGYDGARLAAPELVGRLLPRR